MPCVSVKREYEAKGRKERQVVLAYAIQAKIIVVIVHRRDAECFLGLGLGIRNLEP